MILVQAGLLVLVAISGMSSDLTGRSAEKSDDFMIFGVLIMDVVQSNTSPFSSRHLI